MKKLTLPVMLLFMISAMFGCEMNNNELTKGQLNVNSFDKSSNTFSSARLMDGDICGESSTYPLTAGQHISVGVINAYNDETNLYVDYVLNDPNSSFGTLHLWVGTELMEVPANGQGIPNPGHFPYHATPEGTGYTFTIPLEEIPYLNGECGLDVYLFTHAEVTIVDGNGGTSNETAWGGDTPGDGNRWYFYDTYTIQCCEDTPPPPADGSFETAFAKGGWIFASPSKKGKNTNNPDDLESLELTKNRWGWAINLTEQGTDEFEIWAGAGLNNTDKGTLVGSLSTSWDGSKVTLTYNFENGFTFEEVHVYTGDFKPTTIAPGQYGFTEYFDPYASSFEESFDASDSDGDGIWIIAHAVAFGEF